MSKLKIIFNFLMLIFLVLSPIAAADQSTQAVGVDMQPSLILTASPETTDTASTIVATAIDFGENAGIDLIELYEDGVRVETEACNGEAACILVYAATEPNPTAHTYYAVTQDIGGNVVESDSVVVTFTGLDIQPTLTISASPETTDTVSTIIVTGIDTLGNAGLDFIELYEDGVRIETKSCEAEEICIFADVVSEVNPITHTYYAVTQDIGGNVVESDSVVVEFMGLDVHPSILITADPTIADDMTQITVTAIDTSNNAGLEFIELYEDGILIATEPCEEEEVCIMPEVIIEPNPTTHTYYAVTQDIGGNVVESDSVVVTFLGGNTPPILAGLPDVHTVVNVPVPMLDLYPYAFDAEQEDYELDFEIIGQTNPELINCYISGNRYVMCHAPAINQVGESMVTVQVSDGQYSSTASYLIIVSDNGPMFLEAEAGGPYTTYVSEPVTLHGSATGGVSGYTYSWDLDLDGVFETQGANPVFVRDMIGEYGVILRVVDSVGNSALDTAIIRVIERPVPPGGLVAEANGPYTCAVGETIQLQGSATGGVPDYVYDWDLDYDGTYETQNTQNPMYTCGPVGTYTVELLVIDSVSDTDTDTAIITVTDTPGGLVAEANGPYTCVEGTNVQLAGSATGGVPLYVYDWDLDYDGTYETQNTQNPVFACSAVGTYTVELLVIDSVGDYDTDTAIINVIPDGGVNHPPVIVSDPVTSAYEDIPYIYDVNAIDPDGDILTYSLVVAPSGMTINPSNGVINWLPTSLGNYPVTVRVIDGRGGEDIQSFIITVSDEPIEVEIDHRLLVRAHIVGDDNVNAGDRLRLSVNVENIDDRDFEALSITAVVQELALRDSTGPMTLEEGDEVTRNLYLDIPEYAEGFYSIRITVSDSFGELKRVFYRDFIVK